MNKSALLIFMKNPVLGKVKTRLAKTIGEAKALEVYHLLLEHTFKITTSVSCDKFIFYSDHVEQNDNWGKNGHHQELQEGNDLGERMQNAFSHVFVQDYDKAIIIGSDCYELTSEMIEKAFNALDTRDAVIGPAKDGGYYLLGMKSMHSQLFESKRWSTDSVLQETVNDIQKMKLKLVMLETLNDIDEVDDLQSPPFDRFIPS
ncbi:MAG: TIGR04282 family arsenosugar biosynthesis glycosyltransferase [Chitinophagales bacterium]|nr:TIGR04282 family arsenosugar biosynthesis glycosyltransferase [Chitinophagales bacterium]